MIQPVRQTDALEKLASPFRALAPVTRQDISGPTGTKYDRIELIDLDDDGDLDVLTCEEAAKLGVFWYENPLKHSATP